jgi:type I restriction enzyme M protein
VLPVGSEEQKCWWVTIDNIVSNEYSMTAGRYKPTITDKTLDEDPVELIKQVQLCEKEIVSNLQSLLNKIEGKE